MALQQIWGYQNYSKQADDNFVSKDRIREILKDADSKGIDKNIVIKRMLDRWMKLEGFQESSSNTAKTNIKEKNRLDRMGDKLQNTKVAEGIRAWARKVFWDEAIDAYQQAQAGKTFSDVAFGDMGAAPSVIGWAVSAIWDVPANVAGFAWSLVWQEWGDEIKLSDKIEELWVKKDWWFNAGKIATEIGMSAMATTALLSKMWNIWQLNNLVKQYPKISKWIAKPLAAWLAGQVAYDATAQWEVSSLWQYALAWGLWIAGNALWEAIGSIGRSVKGMDKYKQASVKNVSKDYLDDVWKKTIEFRDTPWLRNPIHTITDKIDDSLTAVNKDLVWEWGKMWKIQQSLKWHAHKLDDDVKSLNRALKEADIDAVFTKVKGKRKVIGNIAKTEWKWTELNNIAKELNWIKSLWHYDTMRWLDKFAKELRAATHNMKGGPLKSVFWKMANEATTKVDDVAAGYATNRAEYKKLIELKKMLEKVSSEWGAKSYKIIRDLTHPESQENVQQLFKLLKELGYTSDDLLGEAISTNFIMDSLLGPNSFKKAIGELYPSKPWAIEALIKWVSSLVKNPVKDLSKYAQWFKPNQVKQTINTVAKAWAIAWTTNLTQ